MWNVGTDNYIIRCWGGSTSKLWSPAKLCCTEAAAMVIEKHQLPPLFLQEPPPLPPTTTANSQQRQIFSFRKYFLEGYIILMTSCTICGKNSECCALFFLAWVYRALLLHTHTYPAASKADIPRSPLLRSEPIGWWWRWSEQRRGDEESNSSSSSKQIKQQQQFYGGD